MVSALLDKLKFGSSAKTQDLAVVKPKSKLSQMTETEAKKDKVDQETLHSQNVQTPKFKKISLDDKNLDLEKEVKSLMKRYKVDSDKYHGAALSEDGRSLVLVHDGKTTLAQNFGGASSVGRFANMLFGFLTKAFTGTDKAIGKAKYMEFFNNFSAEDEKSMVHEPIGHLFKGLASNHYHGVTIFHKDEKTGRFSKNPSAISIIDSYKYIFEEHEKGNEMPPQFKENKKLFENAYALDKTIPIDMQRAKNFSAMYRELAEGLHAAQGFSFLTIPGQVNKTLSSTTENLHYVEMPWHRVHQTSDKKWKVMGNIEDFDKDILSGDDKDFYEQRMIDSKFSNITIVRPRDQEKEAVEPFIGYMENWSQMYSGNVLRAKAKDEKKLVDLAQSICCRFIEEYNSLVLGA